MIAYMYEFVHVFVDLHTCVLCTLVSINIITHTSVFIEARLVIRVYVHVFVDI